MNAENRVARALKSFGIIVGIVGGIAGLIILIYAATDFHDELIGIGIISIIISVLGGGLYYAFGEVVQLLANIEQTTQNSSGITQSIIDELPPVDNEIPSL
jgi:hypothetical protein